MGKEFRFVHGIDYIVDIDFYWYPHGDGNDPNVTHTAKGKFTFQTRYESLKDKTKDIPFDPSTELSLKLYKSKCKDVLNNWHDLTKFSEGLIDVLISQKQGSSQWIDHSMCTSDTHCCSNVAPSSKW